MYCITAKHPLYHSKGAIASMSAALRLQSPQSRAYFKAVMAQVES
jgi:hypothetical protein